MLVSYRNKLKFYYILIEHNNDKIYFRGYFLFLKNKSWTLEDGNLNPPKGEGVQVSPIWKGLETLRFQVPFPKTSNQTHVKRIQVPFPFFISNTPMWVMGEGVKHLLSSIPFKFPNWGLHWVKYYLLTLCLFETE